MSITALLMSLALQQAAPAPQPQIYSFVERQAQLIEIASVLGRMHHLHQTCQPGDYLPDRFRDRMKELVTLEEPPQKTKDEMVAGFNQGFQSTKRRHKICDARAMEEMQRSALDGQVISAKLASPFINIEGYDYYKDPEIDPNELDY